MDDTTQMVIREFEGREIRFKPGQGTLWVTGEEIAEALCYADGTDAVNKLYNAHADEFDNDCTRITQIGGQGKPPVRVREYSVEGVSLLCMFSEQPAAKPFRKWARKVMAEVMTTGSYAVPGVAAGIDGRHWTERLDGAARMRLQELRMQTRQIVNDAPDDPMAWWLMAEMCSDDDPMGQWLRERVKTLIDGGMRPGEAQETKPKADADGPGPWATRRIRPKLDGDPEVKELLSKLICENRLRQDEMLAMCRGFYGADRTPGKSTLSNLKRELVSQGRLGMHWPVHAGRLN